MSTLPNKLLSKSLGTALLLAIVIGSGIMAERLAGGNVATAGAAVGLALHQALGAAGPASVRTTGATQEIPVALTRPPDRGRRRC